MKTGLKCGAHRIVINGDFSLDFFVQTIWQILVIQLETGT